MPFLSFDAVCVGSPVIIIIVYKKLTNKYIKILEFSNKSRDHCTLIKVLKQAGVMHDIKS